VFLLKIRKAMMLPIITINYYFEYDIVGKRDEGALNNIMLVYNLFVVKSLRTKRKHRNPRAITTQYFNIIVI